MPMNASKEECRKAKQALERVKVYVENEGPIMDEDLKQLEDFLKAAEKKLPYEDSYNKVHEAAKKGFKSP